MEIPKPNNFTPRKRRARRPRRSKHLNPHVDAGNDASDVVLAAVTWMMLLT